MPDYPRPCPKCGVLTERDGFALDRHAPAGLKAHCKACDLRRAKAYYAAHREELRVKREAQRQAAYEADLERRIEEKRARIEAARKSRA